MNKDQSVRIFREMWSDIYESIIKEKRVVDIPEFKEQWCGERGYDFWSNCPLCQYSFGYNGCDKCPINWNSNVDSYYCVDSEYYGDGQGLYDLAISADNWQKQAEIVNTIRKLRVREINA